MRDEPELVFRNARIVTPEGLIEGSLKSRGTLIDSIASGPSGLGEDLEGDYLVPGLVELHTDRLELHLSPRPKVDWAPLPAIIAHDAELAGAGITTVLDSLRLGDPEGVGDCFKTLKNAVVATETARSRDLLRAEHRLHIRCELACPETVNDFEAFIETDGLTLVSLMDHTPGQRQFVHLEAFRTYYQSKHRFTDQQMEAFIAARLERHERYAAPNRTTLAALCRERSIIVASHDDATAEHVAEAAALGLTIAEFPTTLEAAGATRQHGMSTIAGAPNMVRGHSHSGNIAAAELARHGLLDGFASDYVPSSLLQAAFQLQQDLDWPLERALATVSENPARMVGLDDRGRIESGKRADLIQVAVCEGLPVVRRVWRAGRRVM